MVSFKGITQFYLPSKRLYTNGMNHPAFIPSHTASPDFGRYSFPVPQRVRGWVGLWPMWFWLHTEGVCPPEDGRPSRNQPTDSAAAWDWTYGHWVAIL